MAKTLSRSLVDVNNWTACAECNAVHYRKQMIRNLFVCSGCGHHHRLTAQQRLRQLLDGEQYELLPHPSTKPDPLSFTDTKPYPARLAAARAATGLSEAVVLARGTIHGNPVITAVMDFRFLGGSLGSQGGEVITSAAETSLRERTPLLIVCASGGARMQEGVLSLMQMAKTTQALADLDAAGVLTISLITDPTYGGVAASFATLCDVIISEPGARLGFAGPRVIMQTIRESLPEGFQTAEFLLEHGLIDAIRPRATLRTMLARLLAAGNRTAPSAAADPGPSFPDPAASNAASPDPCPRYADDVGTAAVLTDPDALPAVDRWKTVQRARHLGRPTTLDYLHGVFTDFIELHGDRSTGDCGAIVGGLTFLDSTPVIVVGHQKGHTIAELTERNFGMPMPEGYRKAARLLRLAEKLGTPVVTLVDTPGAHPGPEAETRGQAVAIAENIRLMTTLRVPVISLITGEGGSGGALALAVGTRILMCANAIYSVISPEGCAAILWHDTTMAPAAADALQIDAREMLRMGVVDGVVAEPEGGAHTDPQLAVHWVHKALVETMRELFGIPQEVLLAARRSRFRSFGTGEIAGRLSDRR